MQDFALVNEFSAVDNVLLPLDFAVGRRKKKQKDRLECAYEALEQMEIGDFADQRTEDLSGGQKQRVAIARAIVHQPDYIFADEPTGALDSGNAQSVMDILHELHRQGKTIVIITHDAELAGQCDRIVEIKDGLLIS